MPEGYGSHAEYMNWVKDDAGLRQKTIESELSKAFSKFIEKGR